MEDTRRTWYTESNKQGSCGLTETEAASTRAVRVYPRSSAYTYDCWLGGTPLTVGAAVSLTFMPALGLFFFSIVFPCQP